MDVLAEYRRRAAECDRMAEQAITEEHRQTILRIAATWPYARRATGRAGAAARQAAA